MVFSGVTKFICRDFIDTRVRAVSHLPKYRYPGASRFWGCYLFCSASAFSGRRLRRFVLLSKGSHKMMRTNTPHSGDGLAGWGDRMQRRKTNKNILRLCGVLVGGLCSLALHAAPVSTGESAPPTGHGISDLDAGDAGADVNPAAMAAAANRPAATGQGASAKAAEAVRAELAPSAMAPAPNAADRDVIRSAYKQLAETTGAVDALQRLNAELGSDKTGEAVGGTRDADTEGGRPHGGADRAAVATMPKTAEQLHQEDVQASFMAQMLIDEVRPWALGTALVYFGIYGVRMMLRYSRMKSERRRKQRKSGSGQKSRSARLE